jgi:hypothetical protein
MGGNDNTIIIPNCKICKWVQDHNFGNWRCEAQGQLRITNELNLGAYNTEECKYWFTHQ